MGGVSKSTTPETTCPSLHGLSHRRQRRVGQKPHDHVVGGGFCTKHLDTCICGWVGNHPRQTLQTWYGLGNCWAATPHSQMPMQVKQPTAYLQSKLHRIPSELLSPALWKRRLLNNTTSPRLHSTQTNLPTSQPKTERKKV